MWEKENGYRTLGEVYVFLGGWSVVIIWLSQRFVNFLSKRFLFFQISLILAVFSLVLMLLGLILVVRGYVWIARGSGILGIFLVISTMVQIYFIFTIYYLRAG